MTTQQQNSALRRKVQAGEAEHQARAMSLPKALRLTLAKVANEIWGLPLATLGITTEQRDLDGCAEVFDDTQLLLLLDGPENLRAAAMLDTALVGALIQQQTMGKVFPETEGEARAMTATDAAMCAPLLDALMQRAAELPEVPAERDILSGYSFGARSPDARQLMIALEAPDYHLLRLTVDIDRGTRQGTLLLCLPGAVAPPPDKGTDDDEAEETNQPEQSRNLNETVMTLNADLNVSLARLRLPLKQVSELQAGDILDLGDVGFETATVMTTGGRRLSECILGQVEGKRAIRLKNHKARRDVPSQTEAGQQEQNRHEVSGPELAAEPAVITDQIGVEEVLPEPAAIAAGPTPESDMEMPDMSDLPGFDDEDLPDFAKVGTG